MNSALARLAATALLSAAALRAAEEPAPAEKKSSMRDLVRARMAEDAKKSPPPAAGSSATAKDKEKSEAVPSGAGVSPAPASNSIPSAAPAASPAAPAGATAATSTKDQPATVLPKVEVRRDRITELDHQIAKQEQDIAREKQNTRATEMDKALNDPRVAKKLSIFGGESAQQRNAIASERVSLMEAEKDILEAMKLSRTKEEKAALQKQLDEIRALRRDLEKALR